MKKELKVQEKAITHLTASKKEMDDYANELQLKRQMLIEEKQSKERIHASKSDLHKSIWQL